LMEALSEAIEIERPRNIRRLFGIILATCQPSKALQLWNYAYSAMVEDLDFAGVTNEQVKINCIIYTITPILLEHGLRITEVFPQLPRFDPLLEPAQRRSTNWILESELRAVIHPQELENINLLNERQRFAFETIMNSCLSSYPSSGSFFIDGPGGTGKTFLYRCLLAKIRSLGHIALACASSGVFKLFFFILKNIHQLFFFLF